MSQAQREIQADVIRVLTDAGAKLLAKGMDGSGHQTVTFTYNGHEAIFHYPCTGKLNGHSRRNVAARIKRMIREMPPPLPAPVISAPEPEKVLPPVAAAIIPARRPTPPKLSNGERRKLIAKRYLALRCLDKLDEEFKLGKASLQTTILSQRGQAAEVLRRDLNTARMKPRQRRRPVQPTFTRAERDAQIVKLYCTTQMTCRAIGAKFGISATRAWQIAHR